MQEIKSKVKDAIQVACELGAEIESLQAELRAASTHFHLFNVLRVSIAKRKTEFEKSPLFWSFTRHAHLQAAVMYVCRVYDQNSSGSHFGHLLDYIQTNLPIFDRELFWERSSDTFVKRMNAPRGYQPSKEQLERDIEFCSIKNPLVDTLKNWRDNAIAHKNRRIILGRGDFIKNDPLTFEALRKLIEEGYRILNYYSESLQGVEFDSFAQEQLNDFQEVLRVLVHYGKEK